MSSKEPMPKGGTEGAKTYRIGADGHGLDNGLVAGDLVGLGHGLFEALEGLNAVPDGQGGVAVASAAA